jgi:hypothetical protein
LVERSIVLIGEPQNFKIKIKFSGVETIEFFIQNLNFATLLLANLFSRGKNDHFSIYPNAN